MQQQRFFERLQEAQENIQNPFAATFDRLLEMLGTSKKLYSVEYIMPQLGFRDCWRPGYLPRPHAKCLGAIGGVFERFLLCFGRLFKHFDGTTYHGHSGLSGSHALFWILLSEVCWLPSDHIDERFRKFLCDVCGRLCY